MTPVPTSRYTRTAVALHWLAGLLILGNLAFGLTMVGMTLSPAKLKFYSWHKWAGVTVFLLSAVRLAWRWRHPAPGLPANLPRWEARAAHASHRALYVLFFLAPLTGWLFSSAAGFQTVYFGVLPIPDLLSRNRELAEILKVAHRTVTYGLACLVTLHVAAALKHHFVDRDTILARMIPALASRSRP